MQRFPSVVPHFLLRYRSAAFQDRIKTICQGANIAFHAYYTKPLDADSTSLDFKRHVMRHLVQQHHPYKVYAVTVECLYMGSRQPHNNRPPTKGNDQVISARQVSHGHKEPGPAEIYTTWSCFILHFACDSRYY